MTRTWVRWSGYVAVAVVFAIACAFLANWQFSRNEERSTLLALAAANYDVAPVPLDELIPAGSEFDGDDRWRQVRLEGEYLSDEQVFVRNRPHGGTSAYEVLVPFQTNDGRVVLVNRGWVPPAENVAEPQTPPAPPSGAATVVVRLVPAEPLPNSGRSAPEGQVPVINPSLLTTAVDGTMLTSAYGILVSEDPETATPNALPRPSDDPGPHLSYAIQWILFAIMGFIFIWYMIRTERRHRQEDGEEAARTRFAKRDTDMEAEDELLDAAR